jgi:hypothetical protein
MQVAVRQRFKNDDIIQTILLILLALTNLYTEQRAGALSLYSWFI